jgi:hypothetical protein
MRKQRRAHREREDLTMERAIDRQQSTAFWRRWVARDTRLCGEIGASNLNCARQQDGGPRFLQNPAPVAAFEGLAQRHVRVKPDLTPHICVHLRLKGGPRRPRHRLIGTSLPWSAAHGGNAA